MGQPRVHIAVDPASSAGDVQGMAAFRKEPNGTITLLGPVDMVAEGALCQVCEAWFEDVQAGYDPPGKPRTCQLCLDKRPIKWPKLKGMGYSADPEGKELLRLLPGVSVQVYDNQGTKHFKFCGRFNYWPTRQKWWDAGTGDKGMGRNEFVLYVRRKYDKSRGYLERQHKQRGRP